MVPNLLKLFHVIRFIMPHTECQQVLILYFNVSSTNSEQCKLCINSPLYIDARLLWKQTIGSNDP